MLRPDKHELVGHVLQDEIANLANVMLAVANACGLLPQDEIDAALGLSSRTRTTRPDPLKGCPCNCSRVRESCDRVGADMRSP
jgi:hypothetical protein